MNIKESIELILNNREILEKLKQFEMGKLNDEQKICFFAWILVEKSEEKKDSKKFNDEFSLLMGSNNPLISEILSIHLVIEHYIDKYLKEKLFKKDDEMRLDFSKKLFLCSNCGGSTLAFYDGIRDINKIRNKFVHNLHYEITDKDISNLRKKDSVFACVFLPNEDINSIGTIELIRRFAQAVCVTIESNINSIKRGYTLQRFSSYKDYL